MNINNNSINKSKLDLGEYIDLLLRQTGGDHGQLEDTEKWLYSQLNKVRSQKQSNINEMFEESDHLNFSGTSELVFDSSFKIITYSGAFFYFISSLMDKNKLNLLDYIHASRHAELASFMKLATNYNRKYTFETVLLDYSNNQFKAIIEIGPSEEKSFFKLQISYYSASQSSLNHIAHYQSVMLRSLPGMDVFLLDHDLRFLVVGGKQKENFGLTNQSFLGKTLFETFEEKVQKRLYPFVRKALEGEPANGEIRVDDLIFSVNATPIKDDKGRTVVASLITKNITQDKLVEEQLKRGKIAAQEADKAKSVFLANISHEMRTPLSSIIGFLEQMGNTDLTDEQKKYHRIMERSANQLLHLVNEIVFLFKLGMGKVFIEEKPFNLRDLLDEIYEQYSLKISEKDIHFHIELDDSAPVNLMGDSYRLKQILGNLLDNAYKYTNSGFITLKCDFKGKQDKIANLQFSVVDSGIGISKKDLPNIFKIFEQVNRNKADIRDGAGLGLGICDKLVTLFGGQVNVKSQQGKGSEFIIDLPFKTTRKQNPAKVKAVYKLKDELLAGRQVLLADDDTFNRMLIESIFSKWKLKYKLVADGREAMEALEKYNFDLVLLDINMPHKSGLEVLKEIRDGKAAVKKSTIVLAVTANAVKSDIESFSKAGFDGYLLKPFLEKELYNKLCSSLNIPLPNEDKSFLRSKIFNEGVPEMTRFSIPSGNDREDLKADLERLMSTCFLLIESFTEGIITMNFEQIHRDAEEAIPVFQSFGLTILADHLKEISSLSEEQTDSLFISDKLQELSPMFNAIAEQAESFFSVNFKNKES